MLCNRPLHCTIDSTKPEAPYILSKEINYLIEAHDKEYKNIIILCIGTDRSTGDCLGPLVGEKLGKILYKPYAHIYGTLREPVHAKNLEEKIKTIYSIIDEPLIIAIDASLGKSENVGKINVFKGPLYPGAGVNKDLIPVGDISITGIVNISGFMEYMVLQSTRLSLVMQLADVISLGLFTVLKNISKKVIAY